MLKARHGRPPYFSEENSCLLSFDSLPRVSSGGVQSKYKLILIRMSIFAFFSESLQ